MKIMSISAAPHKSSQSFGVEVPKKFIEDLAKNDPRDFGGNQHHQEIVQQLTGIDKYTTSTMYPTKYMGLDFPTGHPVWNNDGNKFNSHLGDHIAHQLLQQGYRKMDTVPDTVDIKLSKKTEKWLASLAYALTGQRDKCQKAYSEFHNQ